MTILKNLINKLEDNWEILVISLVLLSILSLCAGGWVFYSYKYPGKFWFCLGMMLQNCMETLLYNPVLPIQDVVEEKELINSLSGARFFAIAAYKVAMVAIPFLEVLAVFCFLDRFLHIFAGFTLKKQRILIVGYNDRVRKLLNRGVSNAKIFLWVDYVLTEEEERDLFLKGVMVKKGDFSIGGGPKNDKKTRDRFNKFMKDNKITEVLLLDESDFRNIEYYLTLSSCPVCEKETIHFFVQSKDFEMRNMLQDYFDSKLKNIVESMDINNPEDTHMDLRIFNFEQIQAEKLFFKLPLYFNKGPLEVRNDNSGNSNSHTVHLLIIGEGDICEQIVYHAMNQGVVTPENTIIIDVLSEDTSVLEKRLKERFNQDYVKPVNSGEFQITSPEADGVLIIRLNSCSFEGESFMEQVKKNSKFEKFTYVVFCLPRPEMNVHCILQMKESKEEWADSNDLSVAVMITDTEENLELLDGFKLCSPEQCTANEKCIGSEQCTTNEKRSGNEQCLTQCPHCKHCRLKKDRPAQCSRERLYLMGENEEKIGVDQIINLTEEENIREYHANYTDAAEKLNTHSASSASRDDVLWRNILWNREEYYKRESNRALYFHQSHKPHYTEKIRNKDAYEQEIKDFINKKEKAPLDMDGWSARLLLGKENENDKYRFPQLLITAKTEHRRFNYFYASMGWGYTGGKKDSKNRMHDCLCDWKMLTEKKKELLIYDLLSDSRIFGKKNDAQQK